MARLGGPLRVERQAGWPEVNEGITYTERVQGVWAGTLLDWYCSKYAASASREQWKASIEAGTCAMNGQAVCNPDAAVPPNAVLQHRRPGWAEPPAPAFLDILWWDADVVAVHKPSGLQVLPAGPVHERCALTLLRQFHQQHADQLAGMPAPVHRLGRGTSGVLICACSPAARAALARAFVEHGGAGGGGLCKVYRALVQGLVQRDQGDIHVPIGRVEYPGVRGGLWAACPGGGAGTKPSHSRYAVLHRDPAAQTTLVDVEIFTGRPHQIRIHMAALGHPLVGDPLYCPGGLPWPTPQAAAPGVCSGGGEAAAQGAAAAAEGASVAAAGPPQSAAEAAAAAVAAQEGAAAAAAPPGGGPAEAAGASVAAQEGAAAAAGGRRPRVLPGDCGYHLHSMVLEFTHPITGEKVVATCPPPPPLALPSEGGAAGP